MSDEATDEGGFEEPTAPAWMATFGDMMSLLLCFFVLLMSFASMDVRKFAAVAGSMRDAFGVQTVHDGIVESLSDSIVRLSDVESTPMIRVIDLPARAKEREQSLLERLRRAIEARELQRVVVAEKSPRGVVLRVGSQLLFGPGSAQLRPGSLVFLNDVARLIRNVPGQVSVEGHADVQSVSADGSSNWNLSSDRSVATLIHLIEVEGIAADRLRATAFGATRPIASNEHEDGRALNRRVEFVFLRTAIDLDAAEWVEAAKLGGEIPETEGSQ